MNELEKGFFLGLVVGEGSFVSSNGGPRLSIAMHPRSQDVLERMRDLVPGSRLTGPYRYGNSFSMRWVATGAALFDLVPLFETSESEMGAHCFARYRRMMEAHPGWAPRRRAKRTDTHCSRGHEWSDETTMILPNGWRRCRICSREATRRNYYKRKAEGRL